MVITMLLKKIILMFLILISVNVLAYDAEIESSNALKFSIIIIFLLCYVFIILEELIHIKKSETAIFFSSLMLIIFLLSKKKEVIYAKLILNHFLYTYCELFLFLFVIMIYINSLKELHFFDFLKNKIILKQLSFKQIYFFTGIFSFLMSPFIDNLTTALIMSSIILCITDDASFVNFSCINIVVASNAGGVFSPFGDITTLMIWQSGMLKFSSFFKLFFPSLMSFIIPSIIMSFYIKNSTSFLNTSIYKIKLSLDIKIILFLFFLTISCAIFFQSYLNVSSVFGMMLGFSFLQFFYFFKNKNNICFFNHIFNIEWETLLFFYGIMLCIVVLDLAGILTDLSYFLYYNFGLSSVHDKTVSNIFLGLCSSIIDNIPITFLILNMKINMSDGQWLLLTYTVATGGSLLSIGSAAGIAVMGQAKKKYTFYSHFKWSWVILIGYFFGIISHIVINYKLFN
ncbi:MAG TPA: sodium:proton antiporter NhaD [Candidatus Azoamicus sp.]